MTFIFSMSAFQGGDSSKLSQGVGYRLCMIFYDGFSDLPQEKQTEIVKSIEHPIRKCAHFTEYAVLGVLMYYLVLWYKNGKTAAEITYILCTAYAASDELHQLFVSARSGQAKDVFIDSCGSLAGIIIIAIILKHFKKKKPVC